MNRILVFRTGQLGDTLVGVPALKQIASHWPNAGIDYLFDEHDGRPYITGKEVLQGSELIDRFIAYPVGYSYWGKLRAFLTLFVLLGKIRLSNYQLLVNLVQPPRSRFQLTRDRIFFRLAGIRNQVVSAPVESRGLAVKKRPLENIQHEADFLLEIIAKQGITVGQPMVGDPSLSSTKCEVLEARCWIDSNVSQQNAGLVAVAVGSKMQSKIWSDENFSRVLKDLWERKHFLPIFLGGPSDTDVSERIRKNVGVGSVATGKFSIRGSLALLRECQFYLGNDTGTMHLAVAAGLKCVAIFSARDQPGRWFPYGQGHYIHRKQVDCEGCMLQECYEHEKKCLTLISPDEVYHSCQKLIDHIANRK